MQKEEKTKKAIEKYADMIYRIALTRCKQIENAEDIFQEVFIKYAQKSPNFQNEEHEKAWLIKVTINLSKNITNSSWIKKTTKLDDKITFETKEENDIFSIVNELPQNYRTVIYLQYYEGYKTKEISKLMKTKEGTIKTWAYRAREILRQKLEGGFENE